MELLFNVGAVFSTGALLGTCLTALLMCKADKDDGLRHLANSDASDLLTCLETSKYNMFYNPVIKNWALVDDKDKLIAAGISVRATLRRAQEKYRAEALAAQSSTFNI